MSKLLAVQLYSVRDALAEDYDGTIRRIAAMGYNGVETAGMYGEAPQVAARLYKSLNLQVPSMHVPLPLGNDKNRVLDAAAAFDCRTIVCAYLPPEEFQTVDQIRANCDRLNEASAVAQENGLRLAYHNHSWEYQNINGHYGYQVMAEYLAPEVVFEIDTYWVKTAGLDPVAVLNELGSRVPLLHIKDGPATLEDPMVAVGQGVMDVPSIIDAGKSANWLVVELDRCATDMLTAIDESSTYLKGLLAE